MSREAVGVLVQLELERIRIQKRIETLKASLTASGEDLTHIETSVKRRLRNEDDTGYPRHDRSQ